MTPMYSVGLSSRYHPVVGDAWIMTGSEGAVGKQACAETTKEAAKKPRARHKESMMMQEERGFLGVTMTLQAENMSLFETLSLALTRR